MGTLPPGPWSCLKPVVGFLEAGAKAPLPLPSEPVAAYRLTLDSLLGEAEMPRGTRQAALSAGAVLLFGAQEVLAMSNRLIEREGTRTEAQEILTHLLRCLMVLQRERPAAYVLVQAAELLEVRQGTSIGGPELERLPRLKDFMSPLENLMGRLGVSKRLETPRLAALLVHMDDLYDDSSVQLQRLFGLARWDLSSARLAAPQFLRRLYTEFARASFADHLLAEHEGNEGLDPAKGTGLLVLLPEVISALE